MKLNRNNTYMNNTNTFVNCKLEILKSIIKIQLDDGKRCQNNLSIILGYKAYN